MSALPAFRLSSGDSQRRLKLSEAPVVVNLAEKYRPRRLADLLGQGCAANQIGSFLEHPYSAAFLFTGPTGVGKTTLALAIAAELGAVEFGGLEQIKSGTQDAEAVAQALNALRYVPMMGSGWKVVIVDEADYQSVKAQQLWLSALEDLPPRSVVIFTTNKPEKFADRFVDRCEVIDFASDGATLLHDAQLLANRVWQGELGRTDAPDVRTLKGLVDADGQLSFRRVIRALEPIIRSAQASEVKPIPSAQASETFEQRRERLSRMMIKR